MPRSFLPNSVEAGIVDKDGAYSIILTNQIMFPICLSLRFANGAKWIQGHLFSGPVTIDGDYVSIIIMTNQTLHPRLSVALRKETIQTFGVVSPHRHRRWK